jgi:hypothetical protein
MDLPFDKIADRRRLKFLNVGNERCHFCLAVLSQQVVQLAIGCEAATG